MILPLRVDRIQLDCLVKRKGKWHDEVITAHSSVVKMQGDWVAIGPLQAVKPTIVTHVRMRFDGGCEMTWPIETKGRRVERGGTLTLTVKP